MSGPRLPSASHSSIEGVSRGVSDFGQVLGDLVDRIPGARGAVVSDRRGDTIDSAHRASEITDLDIQIAGAQIGQTMDRLTRGAIVHGLGSSALIVEADRGILVATSLRHEYLLTLILAPAANLAVALKAFEQTAREVRTLLD